MLLFQDLEIAADFGISVTASELLKKLEETNHCLVRDKQIFFFFNSLMSIRVFIRMVSDNP